MGGPPTQFPFPGGPPPFPNPAFEAQAAQQKLEQERAEKVAKAWTAHKSKDGQLYYYNTETKESSWVKPQGFTGDIKAVKSQVKPVSATDIPGTDWTEVTTSDGKIYFYSKKTRETSWSVPPEVTLARTNDPSKPGAAAALSDAAKAILERVKAGNAGAVLRPDLGPADDEDVTYCEDDIADEQPMQGASGSVLSGAEITRAAPSIVQAPVAADPKEEFMDMLREMGVTPFSRWEKELPRLVVDKRFSAIPSQKERRLLFDKFCKSRGEELRNEKRESSKAASQGFAALLKEAVKKLENDAKDDIEEGEEEEGRAYISRKTSLATLAKTYDKDKRWKACCEAERRKLFGEIVQPLVSAAEKYYSRVEAAASSGFRVLLKEAGVDARSRWRDLKISLKKDPRYRAVPGDKREEIFNTVVAEMKASENAVRKERDARQERQQEGWRRLEREGEEADRRRRRAAHESALADYRTMLSETVRDPEAQWGDWQAKLEADAQGRGANQALEAADPERLFHEHTRQLYARGKNEFQALLEEKIGRLVKELKCEAEKQDNGDGEPEKHPALKSFEDARDLLEDDLRFARAPRTLRERMWHRFVSDQMSAAGLTLPPGLPDPPGPPPGGPVPGLSDPDEGHRGGRFKEHEEHHSSRRGRDSRNGQRGGADHGEGGRDTKNDDAEHHVHRSGRKRRPEDSRSSDDASQDGEEEGEVKERRHSSKREHGKHRERDYDDRHSRREKDRRDRDRDRRRDRSRSGSRDRHRHRHHRDDDRKRHRH